MDNCSCEALDGSLLPACVEVNYIVNNKEHCGQSYGQHCPTKDTFYG